MKPNRYSRLMDERRSQPGRLTRADRFPPHTNHEPPAEERDTLALRKFSWQRDA